MISTKNLMIVWQKRLQRNRKKQSKSESSDNSTVQEESLSVSSIADQNRVKKEVYAIEDLIDNREYDRALQSLSETQTFAEAKSMDIGEIIHAQKRVPTLKKQNTQPQQQKAVHRNVILEKYQFFKNIEESYSEFVRICWHPSKNYLAISNLSEKEKQICKILNIDNGTILHSIPYCPVGGLGWINERLILAGETPYFFTRQLALGMIEQIKYFIEEWNTQNFEKINTVPFRSPICSLAIKPNDPVMAFGEGGVIGTDTSGVPRFIYIVNINTKVVIKTLKGHTGDIMYLSWSPDGAFLASESRGGDVFIWDYQKVRIIQNFRYKKDDFFPLSWSPDGNYLFIQDTIYRVKDWSIQTKINGNVSDVAW